MRSLGLNHPMKAVTLGPSSRMAGLRFALKQHLGYCWIA
jgi:hypothetical protein